MFYNKMILGMLGIAACFAMFSPVMAGNVGDVYYPPIGQEKMSKEEIKTMHAERVKKMEEEHQKKLKALEVRYNEKIKRAEEHHTKMMQKRENMADSKKERMQQRDELQKEYAGKRKEMEQNHENSKNPYMLEQKERQEYFDRKNGLKHEAE